MLPDALAVAIASVAALVTILGFISTRPSRKDVDEMISKSVDKRFDGFQTQLTDLQGDVKELLQRTASMKN